MSPYERCLVALCVVLLLAMVLPTNSRADEVAVTGDTEQVETILRGVDSWRQSIETLQGTVCARQYLADAEIAALAVAYREGSTVPPPKGLFTTRGLDVCRFFLAPEKWICEVAEVVPCGQDPWNVPLIPVPGRELSQVPDARSSHVAYSLGDSTKVVLYSASDGLARVFERQNGDDRSAPMVTIRHSLLMDVNGTPIGRFLLDLVHGRHEGLTCRLVKATEVPGPAKTKPWQVEIWFESNKDLVLWSITVAPERGYMPMVFDSLGVDREVRTRGLRHRTVILASQQTTAGLSVPTESLYTWYVYQPHRASNWAGMYHTRFSDLDINEEQPAFDMVPPLSARVQDFRARPTRGGYLDLLEKELREFKLAKPPEVSAALDGPLNGHELDEGFPKP